MVDNTKLKLLNEKPVCKFIIIYENFKLEESCILNTFRKGYCKKHYNLFKHRLCKRKDCYTILNEEEIQLSKFCNQHNNCKFDIFCNNIIYQTGFCKKHYNQQYYKNKKEIIKLKQKEDETKKINQKKLNEENEKSNKKRKIELITIKKQKEVSELESLEKLKKKFKSTQLRFLDANSLEVSNIIYNKDSLLTLDDFE